MPKKSGKENSGSKGKRTNESSSGTSRSSQQRAFRLRTDPSERQNRPRPRDSHEPDSIPLLDLSSENETEGELSTGLSGLPPVIVPSKLPDETSLRRTTITCDYDKNIDEYQKLTNAMPNPKFLVPIVSPGINFMQTADFVWTSLHPGVQMTKTLECGGLSCGYLRIDPFTVKPFELVKDFTLILTVIDGLIVSKSSEFAFQSDNPLPDLVPTILDQGDSMIARAGTFYSLENRTSEESALHFTIVKE